MSGPEDNPADENECFPCETMGCNGSVFMCVGKYSEIWECDKCFREYGEPKQTESKGGSPCHPIAKATA